jgi:peptidoglycan/xylan/chitin deacetylase (PgdA/CDA1 family)
MMVSNFLFHRVNPERDTLWDPMDVVLFDRCIRYLSEKYSVIQLEELVSDTNRLRSKKEFATIVFDDGYKDNIDYAASILDKYKIKASFYVVTNCIEKNIPTWTYILDYAFQFTARTKINLSYDFLPSTLRIEELKGHEARVKYVKQLKPVLKKMAHVDRVRVMESVLLSYNDVELPSIMMNWDDLRQLKNHGHYIGSHSVSHAMLGTMTDDQEIRSELIQSGNMIKERLGYFPSTISYPVGSYNDATIRLSKEAGYKIGLAVKQRKYDPFRDDPFEIPRIELYNESWLKSRLRINNTIGKLNQLVYGR